MTASENNPTRDSAESARAPRRHRVRHWVFRIGLLIVILLLLAALAVQIVLWTTVPKSLVVGEVEKGLGLRIGANALSTGWLGHTSMSGVKLALPLQQQSFFDVPSMKVRHTNLLAILLGFEVRIKAVELQDPVLYVRQDTTGRWNLQEVSELLARAGGKKTGQQTAQTSATPALPWVKIRNLTIVVLDNKGRQAKVAPVNVNGEPDSPVSWKYDVEIPSQQSNVPPHLSLLGRVAPGGTWAHDVQIWVNDIAPWVQPWKPGFKEPVTFDGRWQGELPDTGIRGFLQIKESQFASYHADGALSAWQQSDGFGISPENLHLHSASTPAADVRVPTGQLLYLGRKTLRVTRLQLALMGGPVALNGWYQTDIREGALEAVWQDLTLPGQDLKHSGKLNFTFKQPQAAPMALAGLLNVNARWSRGPVEAVIDFGAEGDTLRSLAWHFTAPQLAWHRAQPLILNGLSGSGTYEQDAQNQHELVRLSRISLPQANRLSGTAWYDLKQMGGEVHFQGQDWPIHLIQGTDLQFAIDGKEYAVPTRQEQEGTTTRPEQKVPTTGPEQKGPTTRPFLIELNQFYLRTADAELRLSGHYDSREPKPVAAKVEFHNTPGLLAQVDRPAVVHGTLDGEADLAGKLQPMDVAITGFLDGRDASILGHPVGDMRTAVAGHIDSDKADVHANGIPFLGGAWDIGATYVMFENDNPVHATTVNLGVQHLPLNRVAAFLKTEQLQGMFAGQWNVYFPGLKPDPARITVSGKGRVQNLVASYLVADELNFQTSLQDGKMKIAPIQLRRGSYGRVDAQASADVNQFRQIDAGIQFTAWPVELPGEIGLQLWRGAQNIQVMLPDAKAKDPAARKLRVNANADLRADLAFHQQPEAEVRVVASMRGRSVQLDSIEGNLFGGTMRGKGVTDLDQPFQSRLDLQWSNLQTSRAVQLYPQLKGLVGTFGGSLHLAPATTPRPLEPLALDVYLTSNQAHWKTVQIGNSELHAFVGTNRLIESDVRKSTVKIADGTLGVWLTARRHRDAQINPQGQWVPTGHTQSVQLSLDLSNISIDQFVQAYDPDHAPGLGRLRGSFNLLSAPRETPLVQLATVSTQVPATGPASRPAANSAAAAQESLLQYLLRTTAVDGKLTLTRSNLAQFGPIEGLYNIMHLGNDIRQPTGKGDVSLHMEGGLLQVQNLHYFNRGVEVRAVATLPDMWKFPDNPISGTAVGTIRALKNVRLPLIREADAILGALQGELTTIEFEGSVRGKKIYRVLSLKEMGAEIRALILGDVGGSSQ